MKVYRLERNGLGPFTQYIDDHIPYIRVTREDVEFKKGDNKDCFLYACDSKEKLNEFFGEHTVEQLLEVGFELKEYDIPKRRVRASPNGVQYAFHRGDTETILEDKIREMLRSVVNSNN